MVDERSDCQFCDAGIKMGATLELPIMLKIRSNRYWTRLTHTLVTDHLQNQQTGKRVCVIVDMHVHVW